MPSGASAFLRSLTLRWFDEFACFCDAQQSIDSPEEQPWLKIPVSLKTDVGDPATRLLACGGNDRCGASVTKYRSTF